MPASSSTVDANARTFGLADQWDFARLSGDFNPVHLDPVAARRELPGAVVVHGVHLVLWSLNALFESMARRGSMRLRPLRLKCAFRSPAYLDMPVHVQPTSISSSGAKLSAVQERQPVFKCAVEWEAQSPSPCKSPIEPWSDSVARRDWSELAEMRGTTPSRIDVAQAARLFPGLATMGHWDWVADLLAITRIVGMECPGFRSMLSSLDLAASSTSASPLLEYTVAELDSRIGLLTMRVAGSHLDGRIETFYRPGRVEQMPYAQVLERIAPGEFLGQRALVVGGSRGIGEATAKLVAAGGGSVCATFRIGEADAKSLCRDIEMAGGNCFAVRLDSANPDAGLDAVAATGFIPTHVYYFPTPRVAKAKRILFDVNAFAVLSNVFVADFAALHAACGKRWKNPIAFFYPSSIYAEAPPRDLVEYGCAKAAGEALCSSLNLRHPDNPVLSFRLPLVATELSRGLVETDSVNPVDAMLPILRNLHGQWTQSRERPT